MAIDGADLYCATKGYKFGIVNFIVLKHIGSLKKLKLSCYIKNIVGLVVLTSWKKYLENSFSFF